MTHYFRDEYARRFLSLKDAKAKLRRTLTAQTAKPSSLDESFNEIKANPSGRGNEAITLDDAKQHLRETLSGKPDSQEIKLDSAGTDWQECSDAVIEKIKQEQLLAARKRLRKTLSSEDSQ